MSPNIGTGDGTMATMGWQEQFKSLRDADGQQASDAGGTGLAMRPSTCPVPGTKRLGANAWGKPWRAEACQSTSWQDRSLPVVWQEQTTPFSTTPKRSNDTWGRRTKPPSSKYYNYSCLDSLEPDIDDFKLQQASDTLVFMSCLLFTTTMMQLGQSHCHTSAILKANTGMLS